MNFREKLLGSMRRNQSLLCVGLDPDPARLPIPDVLAFNRAIIEATADLVCAYKPNFAFYEALGPEGMELLRATIAAVPREIAVIGDAKRGDVPHAAAAYAKAVFEAFGCDAVTVNPYLGRDSLEPFLAYEDKGVFVLCRTSNTGAGDFQDSILLERLEGHSRPLYEVVALRVRQWNERGNLGLIMGGTNPLALLRIRRLCPELPLLAPGFGAQGGDITRVLHSEISEGSGPLVVSFSREVIYASKGTDFGRAARDVALKLRSALAPLWPLH